MKQILTINRKNQPTTVLKLKVGDLDKSKCSFKFLSHNMSDTEDVYVRCDINGNLIYRGAKNEYALFDVNKHELVND